MVIYSYFFEFWKSLNLMGDQTSSYNFFSLGNQVPAQEAEKMGLVSKVFPVDKLLDESIKLGEKIASNSQIINSVAKECVNVAYESTLREGLHFEKRMFHGCFATKDQKEGMTAFIEKRPAKFTNE